MCDNPDHDHDIPEMSEDEVEKLFMLAGALVLGIQYSFDPSVNFEKEAPKEIQEMGKLEMIMRTLSIKNELGDFLDTILERQNDNKFEDIIKNLDLQNHNLSKLRKGLPNKNEENKVIDYTEVSVAIKFAKGIAWDTCHKIYLLMDDQQIEKMRGYGYGDENDPDSLITKEQMTTDQMLETVKTWFDKSCGLRFIDAVSTNEENPNAGFVCLIGQGDYDTEDDQTPLAT